MTWQRGAARRSWNDPDVRPVKIHTCFFWAGVDAFEEIVKPLMGGVFELEFCPNLQEADIVVYSAFPPKEMFSDGRRTMPALPPGRYQRVFLTGENVWPDMDNCDWAFGFEHEDAVDNPRYMRLPLYAWERDPATGKTLLQMLRETYRELPRPTGERPRFCAFVHRNRGPKLRRWMFRLLSFYRTVDAPGAVDSNCPPIGPARSDKLAFLRTCKFAIAFENAGHPGYVTEKIVDAFQAGCVPIYWGSSRISEEFNPASFIDLRREETGIRRILGLSPNKPLWRPLGALVQAAALGKVALRVIRLDRNEAAYAAMRAEQPISGGARKFLDAEPLKERWRRIAAAAGHGKADGQRLPAHA